MGSVVDPKPEDAFRIASFNVAYVRDPAGIGDWEKRRDAVAAVVDAIDADVIGFQEMETFSRARNPNPVNLQLDWVLENAPHYRAGAVGDVERFPSTQPILYRNARFELVDQGWFFFSEQPSLIYSRSFDGGFAAFASIVRLRDRRNGRALTVVNAHTDARSAINREGAARLIAERIESLIERGEAVVLIGDLNALPASPTLATVTKAGLTGADLTRSTYHAGIGIDLGRAIDYILYSNALERIGGTTIHRDRPGGVFPSDHYPVSAVLRFAR